jgi:hypothetical protein
MSTTGPSDPRSGRTAWESPCAITNHPKTRTTARVIAVLLLRSSRSQSRAEPVAATAGDVSEQIRIKIRRDLSTRVGPGA